MDIRDFKTRLKTLGVLYVDVFIVHQASNSIRFLLLKRRPDIVMPNQWQFISGKIKEKERISAAFGRQVKQKTGMKFDVIYKLDAINSFYDDYYDTIMFVPAAFCLASTMDVSINDQLHVEAKWVDFDEAAALVKWENQIHCMTEILKHLSAPDRLDVRQISVKPDS